MKIHGEWEVSQVRNVVVRAFAGNFNEQGVRAMFEDYKAIAPTGVAWASLAQGEYWEMAPTAALKAYTSMRDWAISHGCQCIAFVCPSRFHLDIVQRNSGVVPGDDFYDHRRSLRMADGQRFPIFHTGFSAHGIFRKSQKNAGK